MKNLASLIFCLFIIANCTTTTKSPTQLSTTFTPTPFVKKQEASAIGGKPLFTIEDSHAVYRKKDSLLQIAKNKFLATPNNLDNIIWYGRRTAYKSNHKDAIQIFTDGLKQFPNSPELYRHRGHRNISTRQFNKAITDLEKAATLAEGRDIEIEPDGLPNKLNIPLSNLHFNIYYHLGLAYYLDSQFEKAKIAYLKCMEYSVNPDLLTATSDWLYMTYQRLDEKENANHLLDAITEDMEIIENKSYLNRLLMYKGLKQPKDLLNLEKTDEDNRIDIVTQGYGVGNWYFYNGEKEKAYDIFKKVTASDYWSAFGFIAAEVDRYRMRQVRKN